jgi:hypothetical protein
MGFFAIKIGTWGYLEITVVQKVSKTQNTTQNMFGLT